MSSIKCPFFNVLLDFLVKNITILLDIWNLMQFIETWKVLILLGLSEVWLKCYRSDYRINFSYFCGFFGWIYEIGDWVLESEIFYLVCELNRSADLCAAKVVYLCKPSPYIPYIAFFRVALHNILCL